MRTHEYIDSLDLPWLRGKNYQVVRHRWGDRPNTSVIEAVMRAFNDAALEHVFLKVRVFKLV